MRRDAFGSLLKGSCARLLSTCDPNCLEFGGLLPIKRGSNPRNARYLGPQVHITRLQINMEVETGPF